MTSDRATRLKKLSFRAHHRGFKEADIVVGGFADAELDGMDDADLDAFEQVLSVPDHDLYDWILGRKPIPARYDTAVMRRLMQSVQKPSI